MISPEVFAAALSDLAAIIDTLNPADRDTIANDDAMRSRIATACRALHALARPVEARLHRSARVAR